MTFSTHSAADAATPAPDEARPAARRPACRVVPFPAAAARRPRRADPPGERRGEILLFLGVRYERRAS